MGLRCSLFGHDFGDTVTERDRNEEGAEVVITVRKIRSCRRCGAEEVVSENTEIRHRESLADSSVSKDEDHDVDLPAGTETEKPSGEIEGGTEQDPESEPPRHSPPGASVESENEPTVPDLVESAESTDDERRGNEPDRKGSVTEEDDETDVDDAIIMDESMEGDVDRESDLGRRELVDSGNMFDTSPPEAGNGDDVVDPDRDSGIESGSADNRAVDESETDRGDSGTDYIKAEPSDDRDATDADDSAFEFDDPGESSERSREGNVELSGSGITAAGPLDVSGSPSDDLDATFVCPACRYSAKAAGSSLRAGDICPNCREGYLAERR